MNDSCSGHEAAPVYRWFWKFQRVYTCLSTSQRLIQMSYFGESFIESVLRVPWICLWQIIGHLFLYAGCLSTGHCTCNHKDPFCFKTVTPTLTVVKAFKATMIGSNSPFRPHSKFLPASTILPFKIPWFQQKRVRKIPCLLSTKQEAMRLLGPTHRGTFLQLPSESQKETNHTQMHLL